MAAREASMASGPGRDDGPDDATWEELSLLPRPGDWPEAGERERQRRSRVLWQIAERVLADGPHHAEPSPDRGRQFIPFAALRGYEEMVDELFEEARRASG